MKSIVEMDLEEDKEYPYLGENNEGLIVMFIAEKEGVVVADIDGHYVGETSDVWEEDDFAPLPKGSTVTLSN